MKFFALAFSLCLLNSISHALADLTDLTEDYRGKGLLHTINNQKKQQDEYAEQPLPNEDRSFIYSFEKSSHEFTLYAVFDGHGGAQVSDYLKQKFANEFENTFPKISEKSLNKQDMETIKKHIKDVSIKIDTEICNGDVTQGENVGSTAVIVLAVDKREFFTVHMGDSQALIYFNGEIEHQTTPHTVDEAPEQERMKKIGGEDVIEESADGPRIKGILVPSRGFGDCYVKNIESSKEYRADGIVTVIPEIQYSKAKSGTKVFLVLGSDGLFDVLNKREITQIINNVRALQLKSKNYALYLAKEARKRKSIDDITVITDEYNIDCKMVKGLKNMMSCLHPKAN